MDPKDRQSIDNEVRALEEQKARNQEKIMELATEVVDVLKQDLPAYLEREVRRHFVEFPDFSETFSEEAIAKLKADIKERGKAAAETILNQLQDKNLWLTGMNHLSQNGTLFEDNPQLWEKVDAISKEAESILVAWKFPKPADGFSCRYRQPSWFIAGRHLKTLAEHYWSRLADLASIQERLNELVMEERRTNLRSLWDKA